MRLKAFCVLNTQHSTQNKGRGGEEELGEELTWNKGGVVKKEGYLALTLPQSKEVDLSQQDQTHPKIKSVGEQ